MTSQPLDLADRKTFIEPLYQEMKRVDVSPFGDESGVFWIMSKQRAEFLWEANGSGEPFSLRGNRLFGYPILFSDSVPDPILAFDDAERQS